MKRTYTLAFIFSLVSAGFVTAQEIDMVSVGPAYIEQAYYDLETGNVESIANDAWDIAFSAAGIQDAGVFINESASLGGTKLNVFLADTDDWSENIDDTSMLTDDLALHNDELTWVEGAFNSVKAPGDPFDFGWGAYNPMSNVVEGNKIFIIQRRDGSYMKFQVESLTGGSYNFRYAELDGSNEVSTSVAKSDSPNQSLVYYSFASGAAVDVPTNYDLVFQRYTTPLDDGQGNILQYNVTGVLLAPGVEAAIANGVDPETVNEEDYVDQYTSDVNVIGHDWKAFDFMSGWLLNDNLAIFVNTAEGTKYKIQFFDFEGSQTGITTLGKTLISTVSSNEEANAISINIYPNPASEFITISGIKDHSMIQVFNFNGQLVKSLQKIDNDTVIDVHDLQGGSYNVLIYSENTIVTERIQIIK